MCCPAPPVWIARASFLVRVSPSPQPFLPGHPAPPLTLRIPLILVPCDCVRFNGAPAPAYSYIGLPTVQRLNGWGISADSRFNGGGVDILEGINVAKQGGKTIGIFLRDMAEQRATYAEALAGLNNTLLIAPVRVTLSCSLPTKCMRHLADCTRDWPITTLLNYIRCWPATMCGLGKPTVAAAGRFKNIQLHGLSLPPICTGLLHHQWC